LVRLCEQPHGVDVDVGVTLDVVGGPFVVVELERSPVKVSYVIVKSLHKFARVFPVIGKFSLSVTILRMIETTAFAVNPQILGG
jgi:hypothetical protein